jgi:hypothetical protein
LVPNIAENDYNYKILSNTGNVITIDDRGNSVTIDTTKVGPTDTFGISYGKLVYDIIYLDKINDETLGGPPVTREGIKTVKYFNYEGANSFADGDADLDGICEACHQQTNHFQHDGDAGDQLHTNMGSPAGTNCTICHKHSNGFMGMGSGAHETHLNEDYGPKMTCTVGDLGCHGTNNPTSGPEVLFSDGNNFASTDACDTCHSPGGTYNGVNSVGESIGAKDNWDTGVYNGSVLTTGKEKWCAGCHDEVPSVIDSISAPNVVGDEDAATSYGTGYGFYKTGHGLPSVNLYPATGYQGAGAGCLDCHDATTEHIDGDARTYQAEGTYLDYDTTSANYQNGYRLIDVDTGGANGTYPMHMPRRSDVYFPGYGGGVSGFREDWEFALCFECHDSDALLGPIGDPGTRTNFIEKRTALENFETGDFSNYPWSVGGDGDWSVQSSVAHGGSGYSAEAPTLADSQMSYLEVTLEIIQDGDISFWYKVDSELNQDYLRFKINNVEQGSGWSGNIDWAEATFAVTTGTRTFRWEYIKDGSGSVGSDTAWIDDITFPNDLSGSRYNSHDLHTDGRNGPFAPETPQYDSDFDGTGDSRISCPACHNVHGTPSPVMFRYGDLAEATSPVSSIVPFLDFQYVGDTCESFAGTTLEDSSGGAGTRMYSSGAGNISRNGVCAMCHNEYWFNGYDNGTEFTGYSRVPVIVPEILSVGGQAASDIVYVVFSEGVYSDLNAVGDLTTADFTFSGGTIDSITHTAGDAVATLDLSVVPNFGTDTISAAAIDSIYDDTNSPVDTTAFAIQDDTGSPVITIQSPAHLSTGIILNSDLTLIITDSGSGIDWTTFQIGLSGTGYSETYYDTDTSIVSKTGTPGRYEVTVNPDVDYGDSESITVTVNVDDNTGNSATPPTWSFTAGSQGIITLHPSGASFTGLADPFEITPSDGDWADVLDCNDGDITHVSKCCGWDQAPGENHSFTVDMDDPAASDLQGRSIEGINIGVYARYSNGSGSINIGYSAGAAGSSMGNTALTESSDYTLFTISDTISAGTVFYSDIQDMDVFVSRTGVSGENLRVTEVYTEIKFGEMDTTAPASSNLSPTNGATDIAVNSNLSLTIADSESGIDWSTFSITLQGDISYGPVTYTDLDTSNVSKTGTPASYNVTIDPDTDFGNI